MHRMNILPRRSLEVSRANDTYSVRKWVALGRHKPTTLKSLPLTVSGCGLRCMHTVITEGFTDCARVAGGSILGLEPEERKDALKVPTLVGCSGRLSDHRKSFTLSRGPMLQTYYGFLPPARLERWLIITTPSMSMADVV